MSDLEALLISGERIIWSGAPDWANAKRPKSKWRSKADTLKFLALALTAFAGMMIVGARYDPTGFIGGALSMLIALAAISFVFGVMNLLSESHESGIRHDHLYAITDRRLIIHDRSRQTTKSLNGPTFFEVTSSANGSVRDIHISYSTNGESFATLHALTDADRAEKVLIEHFTTRKTR